MRRTPQSSAAPRWPRADLLGVAAVLALTAVGAWDLVVGGTVVGQDTAAFFYPMYGFLGEQLRAGNIPGWNPHQFGGAPFAGDPESGWTYLPAMLLFAALPFVLAAKAFVVLHLALAGLATYALGRVLGLGVLGGVAAATVYEFNGLVYGRSVCCPAYVQVSAWFPALLLGAELAVRARSWPARTGGWALTGVAISQILASWLGQGAGYALLALGGYLVYRTLVGPPAARPRPAFLIGLGRLVGHGAVMLGLGVGLAAAGVLPRLAFHGRSNLARGYEGDLAWAADLGGWGSGESAGHLLGRGLYYIGGSTILLAVVGLVLARRRFAAPAWATLTVVALVLAAGKDTPLQEVLSVVAPPFAELHRHWPERVSVILYLGPALLAGAAVAVLAERTARPPRRFWLPPAGMAAVSLAPGLGALVERVDLPGPTGPAALGAGILLTLGLGGFPGTARPRGISRPRPAVPRWAAGRLAPLAQVAILAVDLLASGRHVVAHNNWYGGFHRVDLAEHYDPAGAAAFLQARQGQEPPFRFFGYDPGIVHVDPTHGQQALYRYQYAEPRTTALVVNNRATRFGLDDIQGYNPLQDQRYVELMKALNGRAQEYHGAYVLPEGLASPLLDLLNVRYVVLPANAPPERTDLLRLAEDLPTVYADEQTRVLERLTALPRAWIVHDARQVAPGAALGELAGGTVDPRRTALLEVAPPLLAQPADPQADAAMVTASAPDRLTVRTRTDAAGLLMLSEVYDPGWRAYIDGRRVPVRVADHALRAVPIPPGEHAVELRYEPGSLKLGVAISAASAAALLAALVGVAWIGRRGEGASRRRGTRVAPSLRRQRL